MSLRKSAPSTTYPKHGYLPSRTFFPAGVRSESKRSQKNWEEPELASYCGDKRGLAGDERSDDMKGRVYGVEERSDMERSEMVMRCTSRFTPGSEKAHLRSLVALHRDFTSSATAPHEHLLLCDSLRSPLVARRLPPASTPFLTSKTNNPMRLASLLVELTLSRKGGSLLASIYTHPLTSSLAHPMAP